MKFLRSFHPKFPPAKKKKTCLKGSEISHKKKWPSKNDRHSDLGIGILPQWLTRGNSTKKEREREGCIYTHIQEILYCIYTYIYIYVPRAPFRHTTWTLCILSYLFFWKTTNEQYTCISGQMTRILKPEWSILGWIPNHWGWPWRPWLRAL